MKSFTVESPMLSKLFLIRERQEQLSVFFAEYDALPEIGHGRGSQSDCAASLGAALGLSEVAEEAGGKIIVFWYAGRRKLTV